VYGDGDDDDIVGRSDGDGDADSPRGYYDGDDATVRSFGGAAGARDKLLVTALLERYYAAAATRDGKDACSMIVSARRRALPQTLGRPPGPSYLRGDSCHAVVSKLFGVFHRQIVAFARTLHVAEVRVRGELGLALLSSAGFPARQIAVRREHGGWRVDALLEAEFP
jgi:hypothetical protein